MTDSVGMWAWLNTTYRCVSPASIPVGGAIVTFSGVRMEAYMTQEDWSPVGNTALVFVYTFRENISLTSWNSNQSCPICQRVSVQLTKRVPRQRLQPPARQRHQCRHPPLKVSLNREPTLLPRAMTPAWWPGWDCSLTSPTPLSPRTMWVWDLDYTPFIKYLHWVLTCSISSELLQVITCMEYLHVTSLLGYL